MLTVNVAKICNMAASIRQAGFETFRHHTAIARCRPVMDGVIEAKYSGPLSQCTIDDFRKSVLRHCAGSSALIFRIDSALLLVSDFAPWGLEAYSDNPIAAALVVRPDQLEACRKHAEYVAGLGITRVVFLELAQARRWAERRARPRSWSPRPSF